MTTFQDPQSRRAVRRSESGDVVETTDATPEPPIVNAPQFFPEQPTGRRAAPLLGTPVPDPGNDAAGGAGNPQPGVFDPQSFRTRMSARESDQPVAVPDGDSGFRSRDFSPEARRADQPAPAPAWTPPPVDAAADLDYQTEVRVGYGAPTSVIPATPSTTQAEPDRPHGQHTIAESSPTPFTDLPGEQTLTRRELRALLAEQATGGASSPAVWQVPTRAPAPPALVQSIPEAVAAPVDSASVPELITPAPVAARTWEARTQAMPVAPSPQSSPELTALFAEFDAAFAAAAVAPVEPAVVEPAVVEPAVVEPAVVEPAAVAVVPALIVPQAPTPPAPVQPVDAEPVDAEPADIQPDVAAKEPSLWTAPVGHWSLQSDVEDEDRELAANGVSRSVSSGSTVTNALVLPEIPRGSDIRGPLTGTGETMLTGSIDLPRSLVATGGSGRYDQGGLDALLDANDHELIATDSAPVRAVRAVSTHSTGHAVTHTKKPKGTRTITVLLISASSLAVVVTGLLVATLVFRLF